METFAHPTAQHPGDLDALCVASRLGNSYTLDKAHRIAREVRIARLRRLHERATRNFREAYFAYQISDSAREAAAPRSQERHQANRLCDRARRQMEHWHKRSYALARTEIELALRPIPGGLHAC